MINDQLSFLYFNTFKYLSGVIDPDYRGNVGVLLVNHSEEELCIDVGDRIAQVICEKISTANLLESTERLPATSRGAAGFGSTGVKN